MREDSMGLITDVRVRQPANDDLVGRRFEVAGIRSGFEATIGMRLLSPKGRVIGTGSAQSTGGGIGVGEFSAKLRPVHGRTDRFGQPPHHDPDRIEVGWRLRVPLTA
jgi:hypothetical protein